MMRSDSLIERSNLQYSVPNVRHQARCRMYEPDWGSMVSSEEDNTLGRCWFRHGEPTCQNPTSRRRSSRCHASGSEYRLLATGAPCSSPLAYQPGQNLVSSTSTIPIVGQRNR
eukprot:3356711-Rhodomonas_salina.4